MGKDRLRPLLGTAASTIRTFLSYCDTLDRDRDGNPKSPGPRPTLELRWQDVCIAVNAARGELKERCSLDAVGFRVTVFSSVEEQELWDVLTQSLFDSALTRYTAAGVEYVAAMRTCLNPVVAYAVVESDRLRKLGAIADRLEEWATVDEDAPAALPVGEGMPWQEVRDRLMEKRTRGEPYTSLRTLKDEVGCSDAGIRKAISMSVELKAWKALGIQARAPRAQGLNDVVLDRTPAPSTSDDDSDDPDFAAGLAAILDEAEPEERARIHEMPPETQRALVRAYLDHADDRDGGGRPRERKRL